MMRTTYKFSSLSLTLLFLLAGCTCPPIHRGKITEPQNALEKVSKWDAPNFSDDLDMASLSKAAGRSLHYLNKLPKDRIVYFGKDGRTVGEMIDSMKTFIKIMNEETSPKKINRILKTRFDIYQTPRRDKENRPVLFTGYYEPVLDGSLKKTETYKYPIYKKPGDMITLDLGSFHPRYKGKRLVGRMGGGTFLPYHSRKAIESKAALADEALEMVWLADPVESFFLHIQGSGKIRLRDGRTLSVNYAASNGRVYRSIGRLFIKEGILSREEVNLESIKNFLGTHPEEQERILNYNESYVFFRKVEEGPIGSLSEPVTAGRSIATDSALFPKGALAFIETEVPILDEEGRLEGWRNVSRFVLNQDTGGAIKGPGRVDLFFGSGEKPGKAAGYMKQNGRLYFLIKKSDGRKLLDKTLTRQRINPQNEF